MISKEEEPSRGSRGASSSAGAGLRRLDWRDLAMSLPGLLRLLSGLERGNDDAACGAEWNLGEASISRTGVSVRLNEVGAARIGWTNCGTAWSLGWLRFELEAMAEPEGVVRCT